jgi:type IV pilus assembly protein PilN
MIRINLLPTRERAAAASQRQELSLFVLVLVLVVGVCLLAGLQQAREAAALDEEIQALERRVQDLAPIVKDVGDLDQKRKDLDAKLKVIAELGNKRVGPAEALKDLGRATPDRAWLTEFTEIGGAATLTGQAVDNQTIAQFLRDLEASDFFRDVDLVETTQAEVPGSEARLRKFIVKATVDYAASRSQAKTSATSKGGAG